MKQINRSVLFIAFLLLLGAEENFAQSKSDKKVIKRLKADIEYLASDELEGRRTDSEGERKAADYLEKRYKSEKIGAYKGQYQYPFQFVYGKEIGENTLIRIGNTTTKIEEAFPLPFSASTTAGIASEVLPDVFEQGDIWLISLYTEKGEAEDAHFDYEKVMYDRAKDAKNEGASAVIFYDAYNAKYPPKFNAQSDFEPLDIPIAFVSNPIFERDIKNKEEGVLVEINVAIKKRNRTGTNVAAYIDNNAPYTVVIGAHYDHLGFGEDGSSLAGKTIVRKDGNGVLISLPGNEDLRARIHNGADDNASGTAGLLELASRIKKKKNRKYNYLFVHFSGEELGLLGSKAFVKEMQLDSTRIAYMINMDMIGRLNDSTHALTIGGVGTSPVWGQFIAKAKKEFKVAIDSSGVGPSDHTSFYHAGIPVLFFFTGIHHDYHKPSDDADKINYLGEVRVLNYAQSIIEAMDARPKPLFTPTKQTTVGKVRFKVTLGIMPDYSYQDNGVKVDGVTEGKPAVKAGIKTGDIITQLGEYKIQGMQSYMEALSKFKSGQTVEVTVLRDGQPINLQLTF
ncbi:MAG TPA: M28 family peptidase [Flavipsychrobacter sp.]|nr:M28 family peptidase [Flavipsychrobacter sp.]